MSSGPTGSDDARFVSLADEDAVKEILADDRPRPVEGRQQPHAAAAVEARALSRGDLRLGARRSRGPSSTTK